MTPNGTKEIRTQKTVFDLDSKDYVTLIKTGQFSPVSNMKEFVERLGNDSGKILEIINDGLEAFELKTLAARSDVEFQVESEDGTLTKFTGTPITEEKSKQFAANVLNMAKLLYGYNKDMSRDQKRKAKEDAETMLLGNPAVIEGLKKA